jgi:SAM-dependent MidA family methyltransferase
VRLIELGPGRGTLMNDALRAVQIVPEFHSAIVAHLVEISPVLQAQQEKTTGGAGVTFFWHAKLADVPAGPAIIFANEFFDALPVNQAIKTDRGWHERRIQVDANDQLAFTIAPEPLPVFPNPAARTVQFGARGRDLRMAWRYRGDGGRSTRCGWPRGCPGDRLWPYGIRHRGKRSRLSAEHAYADPLTAPGALDLTAHVDFQALSRAVESMGAKGFGPIEQSQFLRRLGIEQRAASLKTKAARADDIDQALARLIGRERTAMGELFKVAAFVHPSIGTTARFRGLQELAA